MKLSENWIREWANPDMDHATLSHTLTMAGLEVDGIEPVAAELSGVVVGEVIGIKAHPNADKLQVCTVNIGKDEPLNIVCGATNVVKNMRIPTACVGAKLPGFKIKKAKLRGEPSFGMLCSAEELGLADSADGLLPLPADAPLGTDINVYLQLKDSSIDIDLTPNRGDCLSIAGVARELHALTDCGLKEVDATVINASVSDQPDIDLQQPQGCPHYVGRYIKGIDPTAETPLWMQEKLRRCGLRSISPVVDVTNYVMIELGQPMHAFDANKIQGGIVVRNAQADEALTLLDGQTVTLNTDTLVIADHQHALAIAGVMGGLDSSVTDQTTDILLESAYFDPTSLAGCARRYGLHTDSSHRFERGVDPQLQVRAMHRATELLLQLVGGKVAEITAVTVEAHMPATQQIKLQAEHVNQLLGTNIPDEDILNGLTRLGLTVTETELARQWTIGIPSFRFDLSLEADLIEEIARLYGYHRLSGHAAPTRMAVQPLANPSLQQFQSVLVQRGYQEAITYSFVDPKWQQILEPELASIALANPLSNDLSVMRTRIWSGLLPALQHNVQRQQQDVRFFESGLCFVADQQGEWQQTRMLAGACCGRLHPEQWANTAQKIDFYDLKGDVEALLAINDVDVEFKRSQHPALHPGQSAAILQQGRQIGLLGAIHPSVAKQLDLPNDVFVFEIELAAISQHTLIHCQPLSKYPASRRDIALVVNDDLAVDDLLAYVQQQSGELLTKLQLFDIYRGEGVDSGKKSLALGLTFRAISRNLTETEIETLMTDLLAKLESQFQAVLRT